MTDKLVLMSLITIVTYLVYMGIENIRDRFR
jgi:hypothetical protein